MPQARNEGGLSRTTATDGVNPCDAYQTILRRLFCDAASAPSPASRHQIEDGSGTTDGSNLSTVMPDAAIVWK